MPEFDYLTGDSNWIDLEFIERERIPEEIVEVMYSVALGWSITFEYQTISRKVGCPTQPDRYP